jgi:uncharacterized membrane protein
MKRVVLIVLAMLCSVPAFADTGGSMGGGSWGGGGGNSSSGGGGYSSSGGGGYSSSGGGGGYSSSGGGGSMGGGEVAIIMIGLVIWGALELIQYAAKRPELHDPNNDHDDGNLELGGFAPANTVDVTVLRVAIDGRARKYAQSELARIGKIADTATPEGRATMLREVCLTLRRLRDAWVYAGAINEPMRAIQSQKQVFDRHVNDARARFKEETIRNEQGAHTATPASAYTPRTEEGAGLILVSVIIAARRELYTVTQIGSGEDLRQALDGAGTLDASVLVAVEIVWQPSEETDRMSSMELEARYPRPELIPILGALVGKVFCSYCGGPFPMELVSCPHCGAPALGRNA